MSSSSSETSDAFAELVDLRAQTRILEAERTVPLDQRRSGLSGRSICERLTENSFQEEALIADPRVVTQALGIGIEVLKRSVRLHNAETADPPATEHRIKHNRGKYEAILRRPETQTAAYVLRCHGIHLQTGETVAQPPMSVHIAVDRHDHIAINGKAVSLNRRLSSVHTKTDEDAARKLRVKTLRLLAAQPERRFSRSEIWEGIADGAPFDKPTWDKAIKPFLFSAPELDDIPLIVADKTSPTQPRYSLGNFAITFEDRDQTFVIPDDPLCTMPSGRKIAGLDARLGNKLSQATAENPVVTSDLTAMREQISKEADTSHLTRIVSAFKAEYVRHEPDAEIVAIKDFEDPVTGERHTAYYMERNDEYLPRYHTRDEALLDEYIDPLNPHELRLFASFLQIHSNYLEDAGMPAPPTKAAEGLAAQFAEGMYLPYPKMTSPQLQQERTKVIRKVNALFSNKARLDAFMESVEPGEDQIFCTYIHQLKERGVLETLPALVQAEKVRRVHIDNRHSVIKTEVHHYGGNGKTI